MSEAPKTTVLASRRSFLTGAAGAALASTLPTSAGSAETPKPVPPKKPLNVLFFMSDDMRTELGCYGSRFHSHTPNLDKLASQGVRFDRNYCQFPLCNPSRSSMFSGRRPKATHVLGNSDGVMQLHPEWITLPHLFRNNGYTTLRAGKLFHGGLDDPTAWTTFEGETESFHVTAKDTPVDLPHIPIPRPDGVVPPLPTDERATHSDELLVSPGMGEGTGDDIVVQRTIANLRACKDKPFFIGCGFSKPHSPPSAPKHFWDMYDPAKITLPPDFAAWPTVPAGWPKASIRPRNADLFIGRGATPETARQTIQAYLASIAWVDYNVGRVLAELNQLGLRDNTLIVFVADHGYQLGENGKWSKAGSLFEGATRVPLIMHMPSAVGNGRACLRVTESLNVYRTVAELAGLTPGAEIEGESMVPLLHDPRTTWDKPAFSIWSEDGKTVHGTMVRNEQYRYAEYGPDAANGALLFDMQADPMELKNLADDPKYAKVREPFAKQIAAYSAS
jgi:arylsulfatase A-like enzyme